MSDIVIHPEGTDGKPLTICGGSLAGQVAGVPWWARPHCPTCTCTGPDTRLEHGTWVACRCGRTGIVPDEGHELDFMPRGSTFEDGRITFR